MCFNTPTFPPTFNIKFWFLCRSGVASSTCKKQKNKNNNNNKNTVLAATLRVHVTVTNNKSSSAHMQRFRPTCNPRGHVSARSHTLLTTEPHMPALFTRGSFLKGAELRGRLPGCCFGNRAGRAANGSAGIMTCVFVRAWINQTVACLLGWGGRF